MSILTSTMIKTGRAMLELANSGKVTDDATFNTLCRIGEDMVHFRTPFNKRKINDFSIEDREFISKFIKGEIK